MVATLATEPDSFVDYKHNKKKKLRQHPLYEIINLIHLFAACT